jgi:hypothetical protein
MSEEPGKGLLGTDLEKTVSAEVQARQDEALDKVLGAGDDNEPAWARGGETPDEAPEEAAPEEPEAPAEPVAEEQPDGDTAEGSEVEESSPDRGVAEGDLERALSALRRDGLSKDVLEHLSDDQILELGLKRAKVQSDTDDVYRELQELRAKESARESTEESGASEHTVEPTSDQPSQLDFSAAVQPFSEEFGADAGTALAGVLESVTAPLVQQLQSLHQIVLPVVLERTRASLGERFPGVSDDDAWGKVSQKAVRFWKSGDYESEADAWDDAARAVLGRPEDRQAAERLEKERTENRSKETGQFNARTPRTKRERPLTDEQRVDGILEAVLDGRPDDARRIANA